MISMSGSSSGPSDIAATCSCPQAGRDQLCAVHGSFAGDPTGGLSNLPRTAAKRQDSASFPEAICGHGHYQHLPLSQAWCSQCGAPIYWRPVEQPESAES